jgi:hypothetical protein
MNTDTYPWDAYGPGFEDAIGYLLTDAAQARYVLAAHYVRDCRHIVEIGGYKTPITKFVTKVPDSILVLDPQVDEFRADTLYGESCRVDHVAKPFQDYGFEAPAGGYGLVILGVSLRFFSKDQTKKKVELDCILAAIAGADIAVLEYSIDWKRGEENVEQILATARGRVRLSIDLDLGDNEGMTDTCYKRRFMVVEPSAAN